MINYISHKKSKQIVNGLPKLPTADQLKEGEIAINYANGYETLSIKNSDNEIITFSSTEQIEKYVDTTIGNKLGSEFTSGNSANTVTSVIESNEEVVSASLNDLNERKLDASAYTPTDLSDYYKKEETSAKTELDAAFNSKANSTDLATKANQSDLTTHTGNSTVHITSDERTKWDGAATTLASHTGDSTVHITSAERTKWDGAATTLASHTGDSTVHITSAERTKWDNAATSSHTHANKAVLDTITAIDTELSETSSNLVVNSAITKVIVANEKITSSSLNDLNDRKLDASAYTPTDLSDYYKKEETSGKTDIDKALASKANASDLTAHISDNIKHITADERTKWNGKISNAQYNKVDKKIYFYSGATTETPISSIDATDFIKDGMVSNVEIKDVTNSGSCLVITFNADSGKQDITIPVTKIFNPANYYLKSETSGKTEIATALNSKVNTSELTKYYKKEETSGKTELNTAFGLKANTTDLTAHTGDSTIHITSAERTKWNNAATNSHTHANKAVLDTITAIDTELSKTSNNLVVNSAITKVIVDNEKVVSASLNDLNDRKLDASAYTKTDLSGYYKKGETSGATEISTALNAKANTVHKHSSNDITDKVTGITSSNSGSTSVPTVNAVMQLINAKLDINYTGFTGTTLTGVTTIIQAIQKIADKLDKLPNG